MLFSVQVLLLNYLSHDIFPLLDFFWQFMVTIQQHFAHFSKCQSNTKLNRVKYQGKRLLLCVQLLLFFLGSLTCKHDKQRLSTVSSGSHIIFKKARTWVLRHVSNRPKTNFFYFWCLGLRCDSMERDVALIFFLFILLKDIFLLYYYYFIFFGFLDVQT